MKPMRLTNTGEILIVPEESGITEESPLPPGELIGRHNCWKTDLRGEVYFNDDAGGWVVYCHSCGLRIKVPQHIRTYGALREFLKSEFG